ncbi:MAG: T9SS type A sorting domain-containing protein [Bacteroidetes bacterium]|nr:T9SS type A sorting domain-containing protein [Bacteroidota bacterium]
MKRQLLFLVCMMMGLTLFSQTLTHNLYWGDGSTSCIRSANLNSIPPLTPVSFSTAGLAKPWGIAIDTVHDKVFVTDAVTHTIRNYDMDGSNANLLLDSNSFAGLTNAPYGIIYMAGNIFWAAKGGIYSAKMTGANPVKVIDFGGNPPESPVGLVYHPSLQKLFVVNDGVTYNGGLFEMNMDGTALTEVISGLNATAITLDEWNNLLYMAVTGATGTNFPTDGIYACNLDGTSPAPIAPYGTLPTRQVVYEPVSQKVFYGVKNSAAATDGKIVRCDWDGSNSTDIVTGINPNGLALDKIRLINGTPQIQAPRVGVYPNPASTRLVINTKGMTSPDVLVYNILGTQIASYQKVSENLYLDVSSWNEGCYLVKMVNGSQVKQYRVNVVR